MLAVTCESRGVNARLLSSKSTSLNFFQSRSVFLEVLVSASRPYLYHHLVDFSSQPHARPHLYHLMFLTRRLTCPWVRMYVLEASRSHPKYRLDSNLSSTRHEVLTFLLARLVCAKEASFHLFFPSLRLFVTLKPRLLLKIGMALNSESSARARNVVFHPTPDLRVFATAIQLI
ncbi:hypothetical protein B0H12DRAFT_1153133 [Mycena haematopus]|nr:hypothetical protein B0H12DRAFT_1153133 [Mycena haematopus]